MKVLITGSVYNRSHVKIMEIVEISMYPTYFYDKQGLL